jgi:hypothetical protein
LEESKKPKEEKRRSSPYEDAADCPKDHVTAKIFDWLYGFFFDVANGEIFDVFNVFLK